MAEHEHGTMEISEQKKTFSRFMTLIIWNCVIIALILIFLAIVGT